MTDSPSIIQLLDMLLYDSIQLDMLLYDMDYA